MKKILQIVLVTFFAILCGSPMQVHSQSYQLNCDFTVTSKACVQQEVHITYTGGANASASYEWNFDGAVILSGEGQGPYVIKWETAGEKHLSLTIHWELQTCTANRTSQVVERPEVYAVTGGGAYYYGDSGVYIGLSGSQAGIIYRLMRDGDYSGKYLVGTGQELSFIGIHEPGNYTIIARVDGSECTREMEGIAVVTQFSLQEGPTICMVSCDTATNRNMVIWNKVPGLQISSYSVYRETYQNNVFTKIAEVPFGDLGVYVDPDVNPLVRSYTYALTATRQSGDESNLGKSLRSYHLTINPGVYGYNLFWNDMNTSVFEFSNVQTIRIFRKYLNGSWEAIDSVPSNVNSYTDIFTTTGLAYYYIEAILLEPCHPFLKSGAYNSIISNIAASAPLGVEAGKEDGVSVFPNPVKNILKVNSNRKTGLRIQVFRTDGSCVYENVSQEQSMDVDMSGFSSGLYIVKLSNENSVFVQRVIKY